MVDTHPWKSLIELVDVLATTGGSELALTGGDGQVIKADHLSWHQLDTPVQWNIIKVFSVFTSLLVVDAWHPNQQLLHDEVKIFWRCQAAALPSANQAAQALAAATECPSSASKLQADSWLSRVSIIDLWVKHCKTNNLFRKESLLWTLLSVNAALIAALRQPCPVKISLTLPAGVVLPVKSFIFNNYAWERVVHSVVIIVAWVTCIAVLIKNPDQKTFLAWPVHLYANCLKLLVSSSPPKCLRHLPQVPWKS